MLHNGFALCSEQPLHLAFGMAGLEVMAQNLCLKMLSQQCVIQHQHFSQMTVEAALLALTIAFFSTLGMSGVTGAALRETSFINRSLSALADVLGAIAEQRSHVPYRNSKLTHLLQDSVGKEVFWPLFNNADLISQSFPLLCCAKPEEDCAVTLLLRAPLFAGVVWLHSSGSTGRALNLAKPSCLPRFSLWMHLE